MIDLRALNVFMEVAMTCSMTAAATRMGLTQSAVSQTIRKLEDELAVTLIRKDKRPIILTKAGEALKEHGRSLLIEAGQLPHRLMEANSEKPHEIRIGLVDTFASTAGPELALELMRSTPRVVMWSGLSPSLGTALLQREVDVIVTSDALDGVDGLDRYELWSEPFMLLVPHKRRAELEGVPLKALAAYLPMIRYSSRSYTGMQIDRHLRRLNVEIERRIEVDSSDALVAMVAAGVGWAISTPLCLIQGGLRAGGVTALRLPNPGFSRTLSVVCRIEGPRTLAAEITVMAAKALRRVCAAHLDALDAAIAAQIEIRRQESA